MRILGIDPAWAIEKNPSGIALVEGDSSTGWKSVVLKHLYPNEIKANNFLFYLLDKFEKVDCLVLDIPLSPHGTSGRRKVDDIVSHLFGKQNCSTHSPSKNACYIGSSLLEQAIKRGYYLNNNLIETYPHPAIVRLMNLQDRLQYKVNKTKKYWPNYSLEDRLERVKCEMRRLKDAVQQIIELPCDFVFDNITSFNGLKPFEDTLDALVCAWVGILFLSHREAISCYGDENGKMWIPNSIPSKAN